MVKKMLQAAALAGVMSFAPVVAAHAAQVCSTGSLVVCVNFTLANVSGNNYTLAVQYASSNDGGVLTDFGISGPNGITFTSTGVTGAGSFTFGTNCSLQDQACASASAPPPSNGLTVGQTETLSFSATAGFSGDFSNSLYNAHIQAFNNLPNCSVKIGNSDQFSTAGTGGGSFNADAASCTVPTSTPEPASMILLGTGLLGLGGGAAVRRRRQSSDA